MRQPLKIGMIGAGFIGQLAHLMNYVEVKNCRVVAIAEMRPRLRAEVQRRYGIDRGYETHQQLLRDDNVDAVVVVTPRPYTASIVKDCLLAGKHVISEKPMAGTAAQAEELVAIARSQRVQYVVGYMKRYDEGVLVAKRLLDDLLSTQSAGPLQYVRAHCFTGDSYCRCDGHVVTDEKPTYVDAGNPMAPDWIPEPLRGQFAVYVNTFSHNTNLLRLLMGATPRVEFAKLDSPHCQVAVFDFGGCPALLETGKSTFRGWDEVTEFYFADARLTIRTPPPLLRNVPASIELYRSGNVQERFTPEVPWTWSFRRQAEAFVNNIIEGRPSPSSGEDSVEDMRLIERLWRVGLGDQSGSANV